MKKLVTLLFICGFIMNVSAQYQIAVQRNGETIIFDQFDDVFAQIEDGDTIYLPGRTFRPKDYKVEINKKIHVFGTGYYKGENNDRSITVIDGSVNILDGADGSTFEGIQLINYLYVGTEAANADVDNLSFKRCKFNQTVRLGVDADVQYVNFEECVFMAWVEAKKATYLNFRSCFFNSQLRETNGNTLVDHCIIEGQFNYNDGITISNSILEQGGTIGGTNKGYSLFNCIFHETDPGPYFANSPNQVVNCFGPVSWEELFVDCPVDIYSNGYNSSHDYRLKEGSVYKNAGTDGTDIGLYGGTSPFKHNCLPSNPYIENSNVSVETDENGMLQIQFTVSAQEN